MSPNPDIQRYLDLLHNVLDIAQDIAKDIHQQSKTPPEPNTPKPDLTIPLERVARTIRRTIILALKVVEPPRPAPAGPERSDKPTRTEARKRIIREVEDHINRNTDDDAETERLEADLLDRLDSRDLEEEISTRPLPEIITDIVRDLGLDGNWGPNRFKRRTIEHITALRARAAEPPPTEPRPSRSPPRPPPSRGAMPPLPDDPAAAIAVILGTAPASGGKRPSPA